MKTKKWFLLSLIFGVFGLVLVGSFLMTSPKVTEAACGASTSSCKTCHEVKGEDPVSKKGDWHIQHSFGDFCQACHLGAATETDKTKAHVGLVKPLDQPDQTCAVCHPDDSVARAVKYGGTAPEGGTPATPGTPSTEAPAGEVGTPSAAATQVPPNDNANFDLIDFNLKDMVPWLAWVIGIINVFVLAILGVLIWKWKKGLWPWAILQGRQKRVPFNTLPPEVQEVFAELLKGDMNTVLAIEKILQHEHGHQLLQAVSKMPDKVLTHLEKEGEQLDH